MTDFGDVMITLFPGLLKVIVILLAAWLAITLIGVAFEWRAQYCRLKRARRLAAAVAATDERHPVIHYPGVVTPEMEPVLREMAERLRETRAMDLSGLVERREEDEHAAWLARQRCNRHRTGSPAFPCTCEGESHGH